MRAPVRSKETLDLDTTDPERLLRDRVMHREAVRSGKEFLVDTTCGNPAPAADLGLPARRAFPVPTGSWYEADARKRAPADAGADAPRCPRKASGGPSDGRPERHEAAGANSDTANLATPSAKPTPAVQPNSLPMSAEEAVMCRTSPSRYSPVITGCGPP